MSKCLRHVNEDDRIRHIGRTRGSSLVLHLSLTTTSILLLLAHFVEAVEMQRRDASSR